MVVRSRRGCQLQTEGPFYSPISEGTPRVKCLLTLDPFQELPNLEDRSLLSSGGGVGAWWKTGLEMPSNGGILRFAQNDNDGAQEVLLGALGRDLRPPLTALPEGGRMGSGPRPWSR